MFFLDSSKQSVDPLLIIIIGITISIIGLVVYYVITNSKKKNETPRTHVNFETKPLEVQVEEQKVVENPQYVEPKQNEEKIEETSAQEQMELENQKTSTNIATLLEEMQKDLDKTEEQVEKYEADQEENAIISYKELMKLKAEREKSLVLEEKKVDEIKEIIKTDVEPKEEVKKFKRSEFISPIFGFNESTNVTYREIKRPPRKEESPKKIDEWESDKLFKKLEDDSAEVIEVEEHEIESVVDTQEAKRNDNFLEALVDFRNKLD